MHKCGRESIGGRGPGNIGVGNDNKIDGLKACQSSRWPKHASDLTHVLEENRKKLASHTLKDVRGARLHRADSQPISLSVAAQVRMLDAAGTTMLGARATKK